MSNTNTAQAMPAKTNGVDVGQLLQVIETVQEDPGYGQFQFRASNAWQQGGLNRSTIQSFYAGNREDVGRTQPFVLDADEPPIIAGEDTAPNPVEYVLHALAGCLTTTLVYHASVRDIIIDDIQTQLNGDIDIRGLFGLDESIRKGFNQVRVHMRVKSEASAEELTQLAMFSAVYEMISGSLPVAFSLETY